MLAVATGLLIGGCAGSTTTDSVISGEAGSALEDSSGVTGSTVSSSNATATARPSPPTPATTARNAEPVPREGYVGPRWRLVAMSHQGDRLTVPLSVRAWIRFGPSDQLVMHDSINASSGRFTSTLSGFRPTDMGTTLVGDAGADPVRLAVVRGMSAVLGPGPEAHLEGEVSIRMSAGRLVLSVDGYELSFERPSSGSG